MAMLILSGPRVQLNGPRVQFNGLSESVEEYLATMRQRRMGVASSELHGIGLGAYMTSWDEFEAAGKSALYRDDIVSCKKDSLNYPICWMNAYPSGGGPVSDLQHATDRLLGKVPVYTLEGKEIRVVAPDGIGGTISKTLTMDRIPELDASGHGIVYQQSGQYDGKYGPRTESFVGKASILAGMLLAPPDDAVSALATPFQHALVTSQAGGIAAYFNYVTNNFDRLYKEWQARDQKPAATPLDPETITQIITKVVTDTKSARKWKRIAYVGGGVMAAGLLGMLLWSATKKKPTEEAGTIDLPPGGGFPGGF